VFSSSARLCWTRFARRSRVGCVLFGEEHRLPTESGHPFPGGTGTVSRRVLSWTRGPIFRPAAVPYCGILWRYPQPLFGQSASSPETVSATPAPVLTGVGAGRSSGSPAPAPSRRRLSRRVAPRSRKGAARRRRTVFGYGERRSCSTLLSSARIGQGQRTELCSRTCRGGIDG